ncbi:response regulator [bacterium]|nr:MAG: response regulator [bacterium]
MKILIIDESRAMRRILSRLIQQAGYTEHDLLEAKNGQDALAMVHRDSPDLILAEWRIPGLSGMELLTSLNEEDIGIPFGFVTSDPTRSMVNQARENGAVFLLAKPFTVEDIAKIMKVMVPG